MENIKSNYNIVEIKKSDLEKLDKSELIKLLLKQNAKPVKPSKVTRERKVKPKLNYNLENLFDDNPFPNFNPVVTNEPDEVTNKTYENSLLSFYPKKRVSLNKFRKEELKLTKHIDGNSSFINLFRKRLEKIKGDVRMVSMILNVEISGIRNGEKGYNEPPKNDKNGDDEYNLPYKKIIKQKMTKKMMKRIMNIEEKTLIYKTYGPFTVYIPNL